MRSYLSKENDLKEKEIGTEEHPQLYIDKIVKISCECMRVLKENGVFYLNVGDSFYTKSGNGFKGDRINKKRESDELYEHSHNVRGKYKTNWLQQKQKLLIPHRIAIALQEKGWIIRDDLVWTKKITLYPQKESIGSTMPFPVFDKFLPATEYIFQIVKSRKYYFDLSQIKNKIKEGTYKRIEYPLSATYKNQTENNPYIKQKDGIDGYYKKLKKQLTPLGKYKKARENIPRGGAHIEYGGINTKEGKERYFKKLQDGKVVIGDNWNVELDNKILDANPTNAIMFKKENQHTTENSDHFARFPSSLPQMLILASCPPKGIVMDPFMGSATTAIAAKKLGMDFVGIEINEKYIEMSMKQLAKIPPRLDKF